MTPEIRNILSSLPPALGGEVFETIVDSSRIRIERIVSNGHATPDGAWYDQAQDEWVLVLAGGAGLLFEGQEQPHMLGPGDYLHIPAGQRHRVAWTDADRKTVWLAVHFPTADTL